MFAGRRIRACAAVAALALLSGMSSTASAESYFAAAYSDGNVQDKTGGPKDKFKGLGLDLRADFRGSPLFITFGGFGERDRLPLGGSDAVFKSWGGNVGLGYAGHPTSESEIYLHWRYAYGREELTEPVAFCCGNFHDNRVALGGYAWFNSIVKGYAEAAYDRSVDEVRGWDAKAGFEFVVSRSFRLFAGYGYGEEHDPGSKWKISAIEAGFKIPFGGSGAATPQAAADEVIPGPPPAAKPVAGQTLKLKAGAQLHGQPKGSSNPVNAAADGSITVQSSISNPEGTWWYCSSGNGFGWALESDIVTTPAK